MCEPSGDCRLSMAMTRMWADRSGPSTRDAGSSVRRPSYLILAEKKSDAVDGDEHESRVQSER